jgi:hypothetical protein
VDEIEKWLELLVGEGFGLINERPKAGAVNKMVCFSPSKRRK